MFMCSNYGIKQPPRLYIRLSSGAVMLLFFKGEFAAKNILFFREEPQQLNR